MRFYLGYRNPNDEMENIISVVEYDVDGRVRERRLLHFVHHSPTGMEWGYAGSGPADLALALVADALAAAQSSPMPTVKIYGSPGEVSKRAFDVHLEFKKVVDFLPKKGWALTDEFVRLIVAQIEFDRMPKPEGEGPRTVPITSEDTPIDPDDDPTKAVTLDIEKECGYRFQSKHGVDAVCEKLPGHTGDHAGRRA